MSSRADSSAVWAAIFSDMLTDKANITSVLLMSESAEALNVVVRIPSGGVPILAFGRIVVKSGRVGLDALV